jgi:putative hemolysin
MAEHPTRFLSAVQVGITLIGILAGAYGQATLAGALDVWLKDKPASAPIPRRSPPPSSSSA